MRERLRSIGAYCYLWLMVGFFTGTVLLVGPVRLLTESLRSRGWSERAEDLVMIGVIAGYVLVSAGIAWWLFKRVTACRTRGTRLAIPLSTTVAAAACLWAWMNPALLAGVAGGAVEEMRVTGGPQFVFGPYPDRTRLAELKREGYTAVVSLQHPAVVPFEPQGIAEEQRVTQELGVAFVHAPMLPWVSANDESLEKDAWLIPYPNKHELFGNLLSGQAQHVVLLLDAKDPTQHAWLDESTRLFEEHGVPYTVDTLPAHDVNRARAIAARVRTLPRPVVVVVPFTSPRRPADVADTFIEGFGHGVVF